MTPGGVTNWVHRWDKPGVVPRETGPKSSRLCAIFLPFQRATGPKVYVYVPFSWPHQQVFADNHLGGRKSPASGPKKAMTATTRQDSTPFSLPGIGQLSPHTKLHRKPGEKRQKNPQEEITKCSGDGELRLHISVPCPSACTLDTLCWGILAALPRYRASLYPMGLQFSGMAGYCAIPPHPP